MSGETRHRVHIGAETMAAFLEGKLAPRELAEATGHLRACADCRTIAGEMARFEREPAAPAASSSWRVRIAAGLAALALLVPAARWAQFRFSDMGTLIAAAPREHRRTEARVSQYPWAHPPAAKRGLAPRTPEELELYGAAGRVLTRTANKNTAEARHAAGVAHLLIGQTRESVAELKRATARSNDARVWNDLAAALYAVGEERSDEYPNALAAADRAIRIDPKLAEAYFNRALILEKLGLPAAAAWQRYLEIDPSSEWSSEAREHLQRTPRKQSDAFPARIRVELDLLGAWTEAELAGDGAAALAQLRAAAHELTARTGDALVADTVVAIDRGGPTQRRAMAEAHRLYLTAREKRDLPLMRSAEAALRAAGSPMADSAAYYTALIQFNANHSVEAARALEELLPRVDERRHRSLAAMIHATRTNCANVDGDWGTAFREAELASAAFAEIDETANAGFENSKAALALERMGAPDEAWERWTNVFEATRDDAPKRYAVVRAAATGLAATQRYDAAAALLQSSRDDVDGRTAFSTAAMLTELARASFHEGDGELAARLLADARGAANRIATPEERGLAEARLDVAEGVQRIAADPRSAAAAIDRAIRFFDANDRVIDLADAHLQRGRALRAAGDRDGALADYRIALERIEAQRAARNIAAADAAEAIVDETVELHLDRGDGRAAFAIADRAHALLADVDVATIPRGTALLEYMSLPRRTAIFCLTSDGLTVVTVSIGRRELAERVASLTHDIRARGSEETIRAKAAELHRVLIAPVQSRLASIDELIVVPDRQLHSLPFAVLFDGERYLIERWSIRYAPSAARADDAPAALSPAVVIADPAGWTALPFSRTEAEEVREMYGGVLIAGADATRARFLESLQNSALVHYAGHADSNARTYGALMLAPSGNDPGLLAVSEIARLSLRAHHPLVVLSACGTLRGEDRHVAGTPTLARAFLTAGARAVVGTQWEVDDDLTSRLFLQFHQELRAGQAPARALRSAQIAMLQTSDPRFRHPAAWSAVAVLSNV